MEQIAAKPSYMSPPMCIVMAQHIQLKPWISHARDKIMIKELQNVSNRDFQQNANRLKVNCLETVYKLYAVIANTAIGRERNVR